MKKDLLNAMYSHLLFFMKAVSKISSPHVVITAEIPEVQSSSTTSLREELAASTDAEVPHNGRVSESLLVDSSTVSVTTEPDEPAQQDDLDSISEERSSVKDESHPNSTVSTPRSPARGMLIPSPLDIVSGSESLSRTASPLARDAIRASGMKAGGNSSPGTTGPCASPAAVSRVSSSVDSPQSLFFIPANPFLVQVEKMPRFQWSMLHFDLLESIFKSLQETINKWKAYVSVSDHL